MNTKIYESVGVPEGIVKSGQRLYDDFKKEVIPLLKDGQTEYQVNFKPKEPYKIGDEEITNVEINLTGIFTVSDPLNSPEHNGSVLITLVIVGEDDGRTIMVPTIPGI